MATEVGTIIRKLRIEQGLTQKQLGEACGIAEPTIRRYELGKLNPKFETLERIAEALNADVWDIYKIGEYNRHKEQTQIDISLAVDALLTLLGYDVEVASTSDHAAIEQFRKELRVFIDTGGDISSADAPQLPKRFFYISDRNTGNKYKVLAKDFITLVDHLPIEAKCRMETLLEKSELISKTKD